MSSFKAKCSKIDFDWGSAAGGSPDHNQISLLENLFFVLTVVLLRVLLLLFTYHAVYCLSSAIHCMGQNIKSLAACLCVWARARARVLGAEYLENG